MGGQTLPWKISKEDKQWLKSSGLKSETEGFIIAAQDQSLATRLYHASIIKDGSSPLCRMCNKYDETIDHIVSGCPELAKTEYIHRHDKAASYIHWKVCHNYNIKTSEKWYDHEYLVRTQLSGPHMPWRRRTRGRKGQCQEVSEGRDWEELARHVWQLFGARGRAILHRMKRAVTSDTLNITRSFKIVSW